MTTNDLAKALTQKAVDATLAQEKAATADQREVAAMYTGESSAYRAAALMAGADADDLQAAIDAALYG